VLKRCTAAARSSPYYAANNLQEGCTWDGERKGLSNVGQFSNNLDPWYQYYSQPNVGGNDDLADYCGFLTYQENYRGDCTVSAYNAPGDDYYLIENFGEHFCPTCRCLNCQYGSEGTIGPSCHNLTCVNGVLKIKIGYEWYDCTSDDSQISITSGFEGAYLCPSDVGEACEAAPQDNTLWPAFLDISPKQGKVNDQITVSALNFGSSPSLLFGNYHGCVQDTVQVSGNSITCKLGIRDDAPRFRSSIVVDVIVQDAEGRTGSGVKAFTISAGTLAAPCTALVMLFLLVAIIMSC